MTNWDDLSSKLENTEKLITQIQEMLSKENQDLRRVLLDQIKN